MLLKEKGRRESSGAGLRRLGNLAASIFPVWFAHVKRRPGSHRPLSMCVLLSVILSVVSIFLQRRVSDEVAFRT